jgi:hypothetical protein
MWRIQRSRLHFNGRVLQNRHEPMDPYTTNEKQT